jgi:exopolyphosphatase/pppGpp-phosphohydrolase
LSGEKRVRSLHVDLGGTSYELTVAERVEGFRKREVGGIAIKRESLDPSEWVNALAADLREEAERSAEARTALERLVG